MDKDITGTEGSPLLLRRLGLIMTLSQRRKQEKAERSAFWWGFVSGGIMATAIAGGIATALVSNNNLHAADRPIVNKAVDALYDDDDSCHDQLMQCDVALLDCSATGHSKHISWRLR